MAKSLCGTEWKGREPRQEPLGKFATIRSRRSLDEDAGDDSKGKNSLEYALYGQTSWAEPFDDWTYLADVRASTHRSESFRLRKTHNLSKRCATLLACT